MSNIFGCYRSIQCINYYFKLNLKKWQIFWCHQNWICYILISRRENYPNYQMMHFYLSRISVGYGLMKIQKVCFTFFWSKKQQKKFLPASPLQSFQLLFFSDVGARQELEVIWESERKVKTIFFEHQAIKFKLNVFLWEMDFSHSVNVYYIFYIEVVHKWRHSLEKKQTRRLKGYEASYTLFLSSDLSKILIQVEKILKDSCFDSFLKHDNLM